MCYFFNKKSVCGFGRIDFGVPGKYNAVTELFHWGDFMSAKVVNLYHKCSCCKGNKVIPNSVYCGTCTKLALMSVERESNVGISSDTVEHMSGYDLSRLCLDPEVMSKVHREIARRKWRVPARKEERKSFMNKLLGKITELRQAA